MQRYPTPVEFSIANDSDPSLEKQAFYGRLEPIAIVLIKSVETRVFPCFSRPSSSSTLQDETKTNWTRTEKFVRETKADIYRVHFLLLGYEVLLIDHITWPFYQVASNENSIRKFSLVCHFELNLKHNSSKNMEERTFNRSIEKFSSVFTAKESRQTPACT